MRPELFAIGISVLLGACASPSESARPKEPEPLQAVQEATSPVDEQATPVATTPPVVLPHGGERTILENNSVSVLSKLIKQDFAPTFSRTKESKEVRAKSETLNRTAKVLHGEGKLTEAAASYLKALAADPGNVLARYNLATLFVSLGNHDKALALLHEIIATTNCSECDLKQTVLTDEQWLPLWGSSVFGAILIKYYPESGYSSNDDPPVKGVEPGSKEWRATMCRPGEVRKGTVDEDGDGTLTCTMAGIPSGKIYHHVLGYDSSDEGELMTIGNYRAGKKHGEWQHTQSFEESWYGFYREGKKHGWWRTIYLDYSTDPVGEHVRYEAFYKGKAEGTHWTVATLDDEPRGYVIRRIDYKAGIKNGIERSWHVDEKLRVLTESGSNHEGKKHGAWLNYDPTTGHPTALNTFKKGVIEGPYRYWTAEGKQLASGAITDGDGPYLNYSGDKVVEQGNYKGGVRVGKWQGTAGSGEYQQGKRTGKWVVNAANFRAEGKFRKGKRSGTWSYYDNTGKLYAKGRFKADKPDGKWTHKEKHADCRWHDSSSYSEFVFKNGQLLSVDGEDPDDNSWYYDSALFNEQAELRSGTDE